MTDRDAVITGIGIISSLGEGPDAHWTALTATPPVRVIDAERYAPYPIHPLAPVDWSRQIPKRGDQRQMENWQRLGVYAAGLALDDAGAKADEALCATMDMIVAAGGGERDEAVDTAILDASLARNDRGVLLNEKLTTDLRPTLFLAQLSNLLAGNISIVHKVTGSSRTFMGEEGSGVAAIETAVARIRSGQSTHILVGGALHTEHHDHFLAMELGGLLHRGAWTPVWSRAGSDGGGLVMGSGAAFLLIESRRHAAARGRTPYAAIERVHSARLKQGDGYAAAVKALIDQTVGASEPALAISAATGAHAATAAEKAALDGHASIAIRGLTSQIGHLKEAQFPFAIAVAALALSRGGELPPFDAAVEKTGGGAAAAALATSIGARRFGGAAMVTKA